MKIGDKVSASADGAGEITSFSDAGYPRVNSVAVTWLKAEDYLFDPYHKSPFCHSCRCRLWVDEDNIGKCPMCEAELTNPNKQER